MSLIETLLEQARERKTLPPPAVRRALRERAGLVQGDVARVLGVDRASVSRWESGEREPRRHFVQRYTALLERLAAEPTGETRL